MEYPSDLREHPQPVRLTLLATLVSVTKDGSNVLPRCASTQLASDGFGCDEDGDRGDSKDA